MYGLLCGYYHKKFETLDLLIEDILNSGMDPNYEITFNGKRTGEKAIDMIVF
jgi:hypothetical protein